MISRVDQRVALVARRVRRLWWLHAWSWLAVCVLGAVAAAGLIDYFVRSREPGMRWIFSLGVLVAIAAAAVRFLRPVLTRRLSLVAVARSIEAHFPQLEDRLSSALEFMQQEEHDPLAGSPVLRRVVISQATDELERLDLKRVVNAAAPRRALGVAAVVALLVGGLCALDPASAGLATARLALPWQDLPWPRWYHLEFASLPEKIAAGTDLEVAVVDQNGRLPDEVNIEYRLPGDDGYERSVVRPMQLMAGKMVHKLENVTVPVKLRVLGGDDVSSWQAVDVLPPPELARVEVMLQPPAYTGWPSATSPRQIDTVAGTALALEGESTKPLAAVNVYVEAEGKSTTYAATVHDDEYTFSLASAGAAPLLLTHSGAYWIELIDTDGLSGTEPRWETRVRADRPPSVSCLRPPASLFATPQAVVPLEFLVQDDLGIQRLDLHFLRSDKSDRGEEKLELFAGPPSARVMSRTPGDGQPGENRKVAYAWELGKLAGLKPGTTLTFHAVASDYKPQTGDCPVQRITLVSPSEMEERLAQRQSLILNQIGEALRLETETRGVVRQLEIQVQETASLAKADVDRLQGAELTQRQVERLLVGTNDGAARQVKDLLSELAANKVEQPEVVARFTELQGVLEQLGKEPLPEIERHLVAGVKEAQAAAAAATLKQSLTTAGTRQDEVIAALERLLGDLSQWGSYRRIAREFEQLRQDQLGVSKATEQLPTVGKSARQLTPQELADLKRLAESQQELARRYNKLHGRMEQMREKLAATEPVAAETLADALAAAERLAVEGLMLESGRALRENQLRSSKEAQQEVAAHLQELIDVLSNRREHELARVVKQLKDAAGELKELRAEQKQLNDQRAAADKLGSEAERRAALERLTKKQEEIAEKIHRLERRLERLQAQAAQEHLKKAAERLTKAGEAGKQGDGAQAKAEAKLAEPELEQAEQKLAEAIRAAEQELEREQQARLEQALADLQKREQALLDETVRLEGLRTQQGKLERAQLASLGELARNQRSLAAEIAQLARELSPAEAFSFALSGAVRDMQRAAAQLEARDTGAATQEAEKNAVNRLANMQAALKQEPPQGDQPPQENAGQGGNGGGNSGQGMGIHSLAEVKLLRLLQEEVNRRTAGLESLRKAGPLKPEQEAEFEQLAGEQGKLADLILNMIRSATENPAEDPAALPEVKPRPESERKAKEAP